MEAMNDPFIFHAVLLIFTPVCVLVLALLRCNAQKVRQLTANFTPPPRIVFSGRRHCDAQPTYIGQFLSTSPPASCVFEGRRSPMLVADDRSTYSYFGDSLVARPWLLTPEDSAALDRALDFV